MNCRQTLQRLNRSLDKELELAYSVYKKENSRKDRIKQNM